MVGFESAEAQLSLSAAAAETNDNSHLLELEQNSQVVLVVVQRKPALHTTTTSEKWKIPSSLSFFQHI